MAGRAFDVALREAQRPVGGERSARRFGTEGVGVRVLVVEDERNLVGLLRGYLEREGYEVSEAVDGPAGLEAVRDVDPDVVILDWMLPGLDGVELLRRMRRFSEAYVIMLSARSEEADRLAGLYSGADDYLTKPFSPDELVARVKTVLRRPRGTRSAAAGGATEVDEEPARSLGELEVDPGGREVRLRGEPVELTALEFDLLSVLSSRPGFVFSRSRLLDRAWGERGYFATEHAVDQHVANIRKKLEADPMNPRYVQTVRGVGYKFARL